MTDPPPEFGPAPRKVKPRSRTYHVLPIIAVADGRALTEDGEALLLDELAHRLPDMERTLFTVMQGADLLAFFDNIFSMSHPNDWQWRVSDSERRVYASHPDRRFRHSVRVTVAVHWFGFGYGTRHGCYHRMIDPTVMYAKSLSKIWPGPEGRLVKLLHWGVAVRDFCAANNLEVRPTSGGVASQFLTDPRFYPRPRRKVPVATNETAREHLPGNFYMLNVLPSPEREYRVHYLDQHRAHHYHARLLHFPHADHLYAYGYFRNLTRFYRDKPSDRFNGMYCLDLQAPRHGKFYSWLKGCDQLTHQFVFTNELPHLLDMGYRVLGIRAAWGSHHRDPGLNRFADWAYRQLDEYEDAKWLKPILLATYGTLACRPTYAEAVFRLAKRGDRRLMLTGKRKLEGTEVKRPLRLEPGIANVIHRGMIEAATRSESIGLAQHLTTLNQRIIQIYADAVIVEAEDDRPLPPLIEPWEVKRTLEHFQPLSKQAFLADGMTRLPGVAHRELIPYKERRSIIETV